MARRPGGRRQRALPRTQPPPPGRAQRPRRTAAQPQPSVSGLRGGRVPRPLSSRAPAHAPRARGVSLAARAPRAASQVSLSASRTGASSPGVLRARLSSPRLSSSQARSRPPALSPASSPARRLSHSAHRQDSLGAHPPACFCSAASRWGFFSLLRPRPHSHLSRPRPGPAPGAQVGSAPEKLREEGRAPVGCETRPEIGATANSGRKRRVLIQNPCD